MRFAVDLAGAVALRLDVADDIHCFAMMEFQPISYVLFAMSDAVAGLSVVRWHLERGAALGATIGITLGVLYHYVVAAGPISVRPVPRLLLFAFEFFLPTLLAHAIVVLARWVCRFSPSKIRQLPSL